MMALQWRSVIAAVELPRGYARLVLAVTSTYMVVGLLVFRRSLFAANYGSVEEFFKIPAALLMVWLASVELLFAIRVMQLFARHQAMYGAWRLIAVSAGCHLVSSICVQVLGLNSPLNPLVHYDGWSESLATAIRNYGLAVGGTCRFGLLAAGLYCVLRIYRRRGFVSRLGAIHWAVLAAVGAYFATEGWQLIAALRAGKKPAGPEIFGWPVDVLLWILLAQAMLLSRTLRHMGDGLIGRCWRLFSVGIFLITLGDVSIWAANYGYLPWPWLGVGWYIWVPAATAFALAPAYQFEAIQQARASASTVLFSQTG